MCRASGAIALVLFGAAMMLSLAAQAAGPSTATRPLLGVYGWEPPDGPGLVDEFSTWLGQEVNLATAFTGAPNAEQGWQYIEGMDWQLGPWSNWMKAKPGRNLSYAIAMFPKDSGSLASCAAGEYDVHWRNLANNLAYYGLHRAYLRPGWEMDGSWFPWGAPAGSGNEASFAGCFRRVVQVMRQTQPANQWKFMWNPTCDHWPVSGAAAYFESLWPGDDVVDIVGVDCYDTSFSNGNVYYPSGSNRLQRQQEVWAGTVARLNLLRGHALKHGKTMGFPEWALATYPSSLYPGMGGGDNPYFIQKMHDFFADPANKVVMQAYFDISGDEGDFRVGPGSPYPNSQALFKKLFGAGSQ
jgi:Glycosyl hydrolase family 26